MSFLGGCYGTVWHGVMSHIFTFHIIARLTDMRVRWCDGTILVSITRVSARAGGGRTDRQTEPGTMIPVDTLFPLSFPFLPFLPFFGFTSLPFFVCLVLLLVHMQTNDAEHRLCRNPVLRTVHS